MTGYACLPCTCHSIPPLPICPAPALTIQAHTRLHKPSLSACPMPAVSPSPICLSLERPSPAYTLCACLTAAHMPTSSQTSNSRPLCVPSSSLHLLSLPVRSVVPPEPRPQGGPSLPSPRVRGSSLCPALPAPSESRRTVVGGSPPRPRRPAGGPRPRAPPCPAGPGGAAHPAPLQRRAAPARARRSGGPAAPRRSAAGARWPRGSAGPLPPPCSPSPWGFSPSLR